LKISIITPTYNRSSWLEKILSCIIKQNITGLDLEYLVVDNNSTDNTKSVIEKYININPHKNLEIKYILEPEQGINSARNRGIEECKGEYIVFLDDDITLNENYFIEYAQAFEKYKDCSIFGATTKCMQPQFKLPPWLAVKGPYVRTMIISSLELGSENKIINFADVSLIPHGGNMAVKKTMFKKYGMFRTDLGLKGNKLLPGSEYELFLRFSEFEKSWVYVANAIAYHPIKKEQATKYYFRRRLYNVGRVTYRIHKFESKRRF